MGDENDANRAQADGVRDVDLNVGLLGLAVDGVVQDRRHDLLEYLTSSGVEAHMINDTMVWSTLYNVLRLNHPELFKMLLKKWQNEFFLNPVILLRVCTIFPQVYEELKLKNVLLTKELEFFVEDKLINLHLTSGDGNYQNKGVPDASLDDVKNRVEMTVDMVTQLRSNHVGERSQMGQEFFLTARFVCQNIHILKRQLRVTYNKLPWEEMEFCLASFISMNTKGVEFDIAFKLLLNKEKLVNQLCTFVSKLSEEVREITVLDLNCNFPTQTYPELSARDSVIKSVLDHCALFQELYNDFEQIKNVYSLKRIEFYVNLSLSMDLGRREEVGKLVIQRTLHIIGECLKNTVESPNATDEIRKMFLTVAPRNVCKSIPTLRDTITRGRRLRKKIDSQEHKDLEFFRGIQNDFRRLDTDLTMILHKQNITVVDTYLKRVMDCKNIIEVKNLTNCLTVADLRKLRLQSMATVELDEMKKWLNELLHIIKLHSAGEKLFFQEIEKVVYSQETRITDGKCVHLTEASTLADLNSQFLESNNLETIQKKARFHFNDMESRIEPRMLEKIVTLLDDFTQSCDLSAQYSVDEMNRINNLVDQIRFTAVFGAGRIKDADRFNEQLEKKPNDPLSKAKDEIKYTFAEIVDNLKSKEDKSSVQQELRNKKQIYEAKLELYVLFSQLIDGSMTKDKTLVDRYNGVAMFVETKKLGIDDSFQKGDWVCCYKLVHNIESSYHILVESVYRAINNDDPYEACNAFKKFFISFKDHSLLPKLNAAYDKTSQDNPKQRRKYKESRLALLGRLLPVTAGSEDFETTDRFMRDRCIETAVETVLLELMNVTTLGSEPISDHRLYYDSYSPMLTGRVLHDYLMRGDALVDAMPFEPAFAVLANALRLIREHKGLVGPSPETGSYAQRASDGVEGLRARYARSCRIVRNQNEMFAGAAHGNIDKIRECIRKGADIRARDNRGWTSLCYAVHGNNIQGVEFLMGQNLDVGVTDERGRSLLHVAAMSRSDDVVAFLAERGRGLDVDGRDRLLSTALHYAAINGRRETVRALLERGAKVDVRDVHGATPLHYAAARGHTDVVWLLLGEMADPRARAAGGITPMHVAAMHGRKDAVQLLLAASVDEPVDITSKRGFTPLHYAAYNGHETVLKVLLVNRACPNTPSVDRLSPLHLAAFGGDRVVVRLLLEKGADVHSADKDRGWSPLHYAASQGRTVAVALLLRHGAKVDARTTLGSTAVHLAAREGHHDAVAALLDAGANADARGPGDWTPLHHAAMGGHTRVVDVLVTRGAGVNLRCASGRTPLHLAALTGRSGVLDRLLDAVGSDAYAGDVLKMTPLHYLAAFGHVDALAVALPKLVHVDSRDDNGETPLHVAAVRGYDAMVRALVTRGANVNARARADWTPLHFAAGNGRAGTVAVLIEEGACVDPMTDHRVTPLHLAALGHDRVAEVLLAHGAKMEADTVYKWTPIHYAANCGHESAARLLLQRGANVHAVDAERMSPLHLAAQGDHAGVAGVLIARGAKKNARSIREFTALHWAAYHNHLGMVGTLLDWGVDVNATGENERTALHFASLGGHRDVVLALLAGGADPDARDDEDATPLHLGVHSARVDIMYALFEGGSSVNARDRHGRTPLHRAAVTGHGEIVLALLDRGRVRVDPVDVAGSTPLHLASRTGYARIVGSLLERRARPSCRDSDRNTPLHYAARNGHLAVVVALLGAGADADASNKQRETPLHLAAYGAHPGSLGALLDAGGDVLAKSTHNSVLHRAVEGNSVETVGAVVTALADRFRGDTRGMLRHVNAPDGDGDSPLMCAVLTGNVDAARLLIVHGADVNRQNNYEMSVLHVATKVGHVDMVAALEEGRDNALAALEAAPPPGACGMWAAVTGYWKTFVDYVLGYDRLRAEKKKQ